MSILGCESVNINGNIYMFMCICECIHKCACECVSVWVSDLVGV